MAITPPPNNSQAADDLNNAITLVRKHDPSGYLPGLLLPTNDAKIGYFAVRAFWIESGLRFLLDSDSSTSLAAGKQIEGIGASSIEIPPSKRIKEWRNGIDALFCEDEASVSAGIWHNHPTLRLLHYLLQTHTLSKKHLDSILDSRQKDVDLKQYPTLTSFIDHASMSCGSLFHLVLECSDLKITPENEESNVIFQTARDVSICHGLTNALRTSIPVASSTGRIIIPADLCTKYGVRSPRYLLSSLGMGDDECRKALQNAVRDIVQVARVHLEKARERRDEILKTNNGKNAVAVFLPALPSEVFLNRLEKHHFDLTDRSLRSVGFMEHFMCAYKVALASVKKQY